MFSVPDQDELHLRFSVGCIKELQGPLLHFYSRALYKEWESSYESLTQMVVPRSSHKIHEDSEYGLYSVTVFKKVIDEYKHHAREKK